MKSLKEYTTIDLLKMKSDFQAKIDGPENDGRLTATSSYGLDYWLDMVEDIEGELKARTPEVG